MINKNKIKLIVSDLDFTLLQNDRTMSNYSKSILAKCKDRNIKLVFATARHLDQVKPFLEDVDVDGLVISGGTKIYLDGKLAISHTLNYEAVFKIIEELNKKYSVAVRVDIADEGYASYSLEELKLRVAKSCDPITRLTVEFKEGFAVKEIEPLLPNNFHVVNSENKHGFIINEKSSKDYGVDYVAKHLNINKENIVAFGDDYSDIEMLKNCGIGVAPENAINEVKQVADHICQNNNLDGVAKWLEENLLK